MKTPKFTLTLKVTALNLVASIFLAVVAVNNSHLIMPAEDTTVMHTASRTIKLNTEVDAVSMQKVMQMIEGMNKWNDKQGIVLHLNTPGGSVFDGRELEVMLGRIKGAITYVDNMAASMGFDIFIRADKRVMHSNALLMAHRGSVGAMSYHQAVVTYNALVALPSKTVDDLKNIEQLGSIIEVMDKLFASCFKRLYELKKTAPNPEATQKLIDSLKVGDKDIWLTAEEALAAGLATEISDNVPTVDMNKGKAGAGRA